MQRNATRLLKPQVRNAISTARSTSIIKKAILRIAYPTAIPTTSIPTTMPTSSAPSIIPTLNPSMSNVKYSATDTEFVTSIGVGVPLAFGCCGEKTLIG